MATFKPASLLFVYFLLALHGCPGLDYLGKGDFVSERSQNELREQMPEIGVQTAIAIGAFNRRVRLPLVEKTDWIQKPFRVAQTWNLYRDGPGRVNRLEILVDGEVVHRTADGERDWLTPQLRSRRIRPMVESTARKKTSKNWRGLSRFISDRAREDFPGVQSVEIRATQKPFRGGQERVRHRILMSAPDWKAVLQ